MAQKNRAPATGGPGDGGEESLADQQLNASQPEKQAELDAPRLIADLADLAPLAYEQTRAEAARRLGCRVGVLDQLVDHARKAEADDSGGADRLAAPEPWPAPVAGAALADEIVSILAHYVVADPEALNAAALWTLFAHAHETFQISPILAITSPTPGCGKTSLLSLIGALVPKPLASSNLTRATVFRAVEAWSPTLLIDEADSFLGDDEGLRGIIDSGHAKYNAFVLRCVGDDFAPFQFSTWCAKAIALIGKLPATLASRAIHISLRRATPAEAREPLRLDRIEDELNELCRKAARWTQDHADQLKAADPALPPGFHGRPADNWTPIFAIADAAGGTWPARARAAAEALTHREQGQTVGIELLADIRGIFTARGIARITSFRLANELGELEGRPWPEYRAGRPITPNALARLLKSFGVHPRLWREGARAGIRGYWRSDFEDAFTRYLPLSAGGGDRTATRATSLKTKEKSGFTTATKSENVAVGKSENPNEINRVARVADETGLPPDKALESLFANTVLP